MSVCLLTSTSVSLKLGQMINAQTSSFEILSSQYNHETNIINNEVQGQRGSVWTDLVTMGNEPSQVQRVLLRV